MRKRAVRLIANASRAAHARTYPSRALGVARQWQYPDGADRLVAAPVFVLGPMRSGSTTLRTMLDSHSRICAPHDLFLGTWRVETTSRNAQSALEAAGFSPAELANLLWDRVMHLELIKARKSIIVDKTPRNTLQWQRIAEVWPEARFLVLLRHPARVAASLAAAHPELPESKHHGEIERYARAVHEAQRTAKHALTVRYEDLVADPATTTRRITDWLGVPWEQRMITGLDGLVPAITAGPASSGVSGVTAESDPGEVPDGLRVSCELLGYL